MARRLLLPLGMLFLPVIGGCGRQADPAPAKPTPNTRPSTIEAMGIGFVKISAGSYEAGCPSGRFSIGRAASTPRRVTISKDFWMSECELTRTEWASLCKRTGIAYEPPRGNAELPVTHIPWMTAVEVLTRNGLRLPTEAEWEYACRGGASTAYPWGDDAEEADRFVNFAGLGSTAWLDEERHVVTSDPICIRPPRSLQPNGWGLYDMLGNVWEWCHDWAAIPADSSTVPTMREVDPTGPEVGVRRVRRGGACSGVLVPPCFRSSADPLLGRGDTGVRAVRSVP
jgi:formylglycine-generating enzyme required for sulfatase activity